MPRRAGLRERSPTQISFLEAEDWMPAYARERFTRWTLRVARLGLLVVADNALPWLPILCARQSTTKHRFISPNAAAAHVNLLLPKLHDHSIQAIAQAEPGAVGHDVTLDSQPAHSGHPQPDVIAINTATLRVTGLQTPVRPTWIRVSCEQSQHR